MTNRFSQSFAVLILRFGAIFLILVYLLIGCATRTSVSEERTEKIPVEKLQKMNSLTKSERELQKESKGENSAEKTQEDVAMEKLEEALSIEKFTPDRPVEEIMSDMLVDTLEGALEAAQTPIEDIGLIEDPIPEELQKYMKNPYALPEPMTCQETLKQITRLDQLLGSDVSAPAEKNGVASVKSGEYITRGSKAAQDRVGDTVTGYVNILPFRSIVRYLSGAEKQVREIEKAQRAGIARRSFLKGLAKGHGCKPLPTSLLETGEINTETEALGSDLKPESKPEPETRERPRRR
jgi:hypothetical protein